MILAALLSLALQEQPAEQQRLDDLERQIEERERSAAEIRERTEESEDVLNRLREQLVSTASALQAAESRATELEADLQDIEAREAAALEELDQRALELSQVLAAIQNLERAKPPALVVAPDDAQKAALAAITLSSLMPRLNQIVEARREEILELARLREEKREAREQLDETNDALAERRRLLEGLMNDRQEIYDQDRAALRQVEQESRRLAAEASSIRDLLARLRELPSTQEILDSYQASRLDRDLPSSFSDARGQLLLPVAGRVIRAFGDPNDAGDPAGSMQLATRPGAVVTAPFSGVVQWASRVGTLGNVLIINVGGGYVQVFMGIDNFIVRQGQSISAGEPVGVMSPRDGAPRLEFQVRRNGQPVDPEPWFQD